MASVSFNDSKHWGNFRASLRASRCTRKRGRDRRRKWLAFRSQKYADYPIDKVWILGRLADAATSHSGAMGSYVRSYLATTTVLVGRCRDILPMPLLKSNEFKPTGWTPYRWKVLQQFVGVVLSGLSFMYSVNLERGLPVSFNASQKVVCVRLIDKTVNLIHRLQGADESEVLRGLPRWYDDPTANGATVYPTYVAKQIDSPDVAASVDPDKWMPVEARAIVSKPAELFREAAPGLSRFGGIAESDRSEYVKHTANLLRCGKLQLSGYAHAGGTVFVVGKPKLGSDGLRRLREVWHGTRVSNAAVAPPKPPHLADVTSLTHLQLRGDELLRVSKRDAQCCFDQLKLYPELGVWMARPLVKKHELITIGGLSAAEINEMCANPEATNLDAVFPIPVTWVMGFSWSSFVSQTTMLGICSEAGLSDDLVLSADRPTPSQTKCVFAVATDDVILMSTAGPGSTTSFAQAVEKSMEANGMKCHTDKNVDDQLDALCIGVALENGLRWTAPPNKVMVMLMTVIRLAQRGWGSPFQVQQILSTLQWYDLIFRAKLSVYQHIYGFTNGGQDKRGKNIPSRVLGELVLSALLAIFWSADLRRPLLPLICCSDASSSFGFGGSILKTSDDVVQKLARLALKDDAFAVLDNGARARDYHKRIGSLHGIGVSRDAFTHVFSVRQTRDDHINRLEGEALLLMLRWILRSSMRHASRVVILLDSAVLLGGAAKGRSSSRLNTILRRAAALQLLGDLLVYWVLVPSAENPSDIPSRGRWR